MCKNLFKQKKRNRRKKDQITLEIIYLLYFILFLN